MCCRPLPWIEICIPCCNTLKCHIYSFKKCRVIALQINFILLTKGCNLNLPLVISFLACHTMSCKAVFLLCNKNSSYFACTGSSSWSKGRVQKLCFLLQCVFSCFPLLTKHISIVEAKLLNCMTTSYLSWKTCFPLFLSFIF